MSGVFEQFPYTNFHDLNLDWILQKMKEAISQVDINNAKVELLSDKCDEFQEELNVVNSAITAINNELEKVENGEYVQLYLNSIISWIDNNLQQLVANIVKYVAFEIDDSGYFIANIPDTWKFLKFDTIVDTNNPDYGHLILEW